jgi:hypothetical protein
MQVAQLSVEAFADDLIVTNHDCTNQRIWTDLTSPALGEFERTLQMSLIRGGN